MISVLIPIYNYNIVDLVNRLHSQLTKVNVAFEIICIDDASKESYTKKNLQINNLPYTNLIVSEVNNGRVKTRQLLSSKAKFEWLLFLDADVLPKSDDFISKYLEFLNKEYKAIYGGFAYYKTTPEPQFMLRWKYGKKHEEVDAQIRNRTPYKVIISANFLITKTCFNHIHLKIKDEGYGFDNYFGALLKENNISVYHINNEVYHLGIEKSDTYLTKKELAAETLLKLDQENKNIKHDNNLLALFLNLKRFYLHYIFALFFKLFKKIMRQNLLSNNPSITLLQTYRISYMCYKYLA
ncbi:glycosyltransferase family 2 protein [Meridianimaribacter flavus]|uniref:Glycosyltransferase involved in cell wall biosynthesis n=1 Tax=Meridianimaribacter flavus TaxID=571115 RepID=A0ABY2GAG1_9FLAO|nr:glycosyltransferase family 2 protein [Meridianimaribacter flavus]TDY14231.1 glycosyltransferase involved in cell wall biosynthesis [Meridianimaribacter flavus]